MCLDSGTPKTIDFPFGTNEKLVGLGAATLKICLQNFIELTTRTFILITSEVFDKTHQSYAFL